MKVGDGEFVSSVGKVKEEEDNEENGDEGEECSSSERGDVEEVVDDERGGNGIDREGDGEMECVECAENDDG
ncbi:hypothetical protein, partial [Staphylococcus epidermidis]|uniref:hypothetical protein n=1 Tax=Staphylococcus epidermidis TaxID=1282 RepID=UPI001C92CECB